MTACLEDQKDHFTISWLKQLTLNEETLQISFINENFALSL